MEKCNAYYLWNSLIFKSIIDNNIKGPNIGSIQNSGIQNNVSNSTILLTFITLTCKFSANFQ